MIQVNICLSDIPKEKNKVGNNGKKYLNLILSERKEVGNYGETHTLTISKTKEEREANEPTVYVGSGKEYKPQKEVVTPEKIDEMPSYSSQEEDNGLPF